MRLILGSSSLVRRKILEDAGIIFEVVKPEIDEKKIRATDDRLIPVVLSFAKAQAVAAKVSGPAVIIACDQVIICNGQLIEKPENADEVRAWYRLYTQYPVEHINGITVCNTETDTYLTAQETSAISFKEIPEEFMEEQIRKGLIYNHCGGIDSELEDTYSKLIRGTKDSPKGLPLDFVMNMIERVK